MGLAICLSIGPIGDRIPRSWRLAAAQRGLMVLFSGRHPAKKRTLIHWWMSISRNNDRKWGFLPGIHGYTPFADTPKRRRCSVFVQLLVFIHHWEKCQSTSLVPKKALPISLVVQQPQLLDDIWVSIKTMYCTLVKHGNNASNWNNEGMGYGFFWG